MPVTQLEITDLNADSFAEFGDVVQADGAFKTINAGTTRNFADLASIDVTAEGGRAQVNIYRATPVVMPFTIRMLERHPLSSQLFIPLERKPFLVVVAPPGASIDPGKVRGFVTNGSQGVNYAPGTWHYPVLALDSESDFLVVDRAGPGENCDEFLFDGSVQPVIAPDVSWT
jgi:ureidoglycolate lyase